MIDFVGDEKVALVDSISEGSVITVSFNTRATEYNGRYYNNLNGWRIEGNNASGSNEQSAPAAKKQAKIEEDFDDLPF
jgi:single-strand DNA-binding protein